MTLPILTTKLHVPPPGPRVVERAWLIQRLNAGLEAGCQLTVVSASAGSGKTTLVSLWSACCERPVAWLSLDAGDNNVGRFLTYLVAALQTLFPQFGTGLLVALQSPQPPVLQGLLTSLLSEMQQISQPFMLVLDDCHVLDAPEVDQVLAFLLEHLPLQVHVVMASREDPSFPLARLRARGKLNELRVSDLRFTPSEASEFLNHHMNLQLSAEDVQLLEARTEGWIAGLQLAALSMQGQTDRKAFVRSFAGSHRFVLDYLMEEVLSQQPPELQTFLLCTSLLGRMCGPLCAAVLGMDPTTGQAMLERLERANLFVIPLDHERRWYRYHHLFADLLQQRLPWACWPTLKAPP